MGKGIIPKLEKNFSTMFFDLYLDPYEKNDIAENNSYIVKMMKSRIRKMEKNFPTSCDWMSTDRKLKYQMDKSYDWKRTHRCFA